MGPKAEQLARKEKKILSKFFVKKYGIGPRKIDYTGIL
jgi:hypothetical protein